MTDRVYKVYAIDNGTVIDHIPAPLALKVVEILGIGDEGIFTIGVGFHSRRLPEGKGIVKIENRVLSTNETDMIALISPEATINIIREGRVDEKRRISLPETVTGVLKCPNPNCATNMLGAQRRFGLEEAETVTYRCHYCERSMRVSADQLVAPDL
jgi:aspartate carbamoyltransferase regulatory subunit